MFCLVYLEINNILKNLECCRHKTCLKVQPGVTSPGLQIIICVFLFVVLVLSHYYFYFFSLRLDPSVVFLFFFSFIIIIIIIFLFLFFSHWSSGFVVVFCLCTEWVKKFLDSVEPIGIRIGMKVCFMFVFLLSVFLL